MIVTLFKTYISMNAKVLREELADRLTRNGFDLEKADLIVRSANDGFRYAVRDLFQGRENFKTKEGVPCKLLINEAKQADEDVRLDVHVRADGKTVEFSGLLCSFILVRGDAQFCTHSDKAPAILNAIGVTEVNPQKLVAEGTSYMYHRDLRRTMDRIISGTPDIGGWRGIHFAFGESARDELARAQKVFSALPHGECSISSLSVENSEANRQQLVKDVTANFKERFQFLLSKLREDIAPDTKRIRREYTSLLTAHKEMEEQLGEGINVLNLANIVDLTIIMKEQEA